MSIAQKQSPLLCVTSLLLPLLPSAPLPVSLLLSISAFPPNEMFSTSFHRYALFLFLSISPSLSLSLFLPLFHFPLSFPLSISPLTNKQVSRELLSHSACVPQRGHRPVWPLWRPEPHRDWLRRENCSERNRERQTGIACLRQKHRASCQPLSLRGEDWR